MPSVLRIVLRAVVDAQRVPSRAALAAATGLSRAAVSVAVDQLLAAGLVQELDPLPAFGAGRPGVPIVPGHSAVAGLGLEINFDYLGVRAVNLMGDVLSETVVFGDIRGADPQHVVADLAAAAGPVIAGLVDEGVAVVGLTVAVPGLVDRSAGLLRSGGELGWYDTDLVGFLRRALPDFEAVLVNEAHLAAQAELRLRRPDASFIYLSGEPRISGAVVVHGKILDGVHGWAGAIGEVLVDASRGAGGSLERLVGQRSLLQVVGMDPGLGLLGLVSAIEDGDTKAIEAVRQAGTLLGAGLSSVVNVVDVQAIVIGGALWPIADYLAAPVIDQLQVRVPWSRWADFQVTAATAGDLPGLTGAAWRSLQRVVDDPESFLA